MAQALVLAGSRLVSTLVFGRPPCAEMSLGAAGTSACATILTLLFTLGGSTLLAQHEVAPAQMVEEGKQLFRAACAGCHGADGNYVPSVNLGIGKFRRAYSDQEIITIIRGGIAGTDMPPNDISEAEAARIVAYFRSQAANVAASTLPPGGNAGRGKAIFEGKGACNTCHRVAGNGSRLGPDLTDIGAARVPADLERSILDPGASVAPQNRFYKVVTKSGVTVTGRLLQQDSFNVLLMDPQERLRSFPKADLREYSMLKTSQMPSYQGKLSAAEVADLVTYLFSLKGIEAR